MYAMADMIETMSASVPPDFIAALAAATPATRARRLEKALDARVFDGGHGGLRQVE